MRYGLNMLATTDRVRLVPEGLVGYGVLPITWRKERTMRRRSETTTATDGQTSARGGGAGAALAAHWVAVVIAVVVLVFIAQNRATTTIELFWLTVDAPLWFVLVCTVACGALIGLLMTRRKAPEAGKKR